MAVKKMTTKNKWTVALSIVMVAVIAIGVTLALLSTTTNEKINNFQIVGDIDVIIDEDFEEEDGKNMVPGVAVEKKPWMENKSEQEVYVAMQMILVGGNGTTYDPADILDTNDYEELMDMIAIRYTNPPVITNYNLATNATDENTDEWLYANAVDKDEKNKTIFIYNTILDARTGNADPYTYDKTTELFNEVEILTTADSEWIRDTLGGFQIVLRGAGVQANGITFAEAKTELVRLLTEN